MSKWLFGFFVFLLAAIIHSSHAKVTFDPVNKIKITSEIKSWAKNIKLQAQYEILQA